MARMRPIASDPQPMLSPLTDAAVEGDAGCELSPAEQHALLRCAPLSTAEFKAVGRLVGRGDLSLGRLLRRHHPR